MLLPATGEKQTMPTVERPGKAAVYAEIPAGLKAEFSRLADSLGSNFTEQLVLAMRRHLAYPPGKPEIPPLPGGGRARAKKIREAP
jgi:hypothetical protein